MLMSESEKQSDANENGLSDSNQSTNCRSSDEFKIGIGDFVKVRSTRYIEQTLDSDGCLDGLPFMPEMLEMCGRKFRVKTIANKTCVAGQYVGTLNDVYVLQTDKRCDGSAHGDCQMACNFFWKRSWLEQPDGSGNGAAEENVESLEKFLVERSTKNASCFRCQATELITIAPSSSAFKPNQYIKDIRSGIPAFAVVKFLFGLLAKKLLRRSDNLVGPCTGRTPLVKLDLKVGDKVRVKSLEGIRETLDPNGCNRGLWFDPAEMATFCDREMVVSRVVHRLIDEETGELKILKVPSVVLSETECSGLFRRFCSRGMLHFWREAWLERV